jgi:hypothetical protein
MSSVAPLRMIAFQCLFLLIAIAIEGYILRRELAIAPRPSIEYAASVNLLSTLVGWLVFFGIEPLIPLPLRVQLLNCIFFDQWSSSMASWIIPAGFVTFFVSFFIKLQGLTQLQALLQYPQPKPAEPEKTSKIFTSNRPRQGSKQASAILLANSLSYSAISFVLLFRLLAQAQVR